MAHELSTTIDAVSDPDRSTVYTAVDTAEEIHRPLPKPHPACFTKDDLVDLVARIDLETAEVEWACRSLPLPADPDLDAWAFFVEAAPGVWIMFDDLPEELAAALLKQNLYELTRRAIQRPFGAERLAELINEIRQTDPAAAVVNWRYDECFDPYRMGDVPHLSRGREHFVQAPSGQWVWFGDLPDDVHKALSRAHSPKSALHVWEEDL